MALPGEEAAYRTLYSPFSTSGDKAEASVKLAEIEEIKRRNAESDRRYHEQKNFCPHCGGKL